LRQAGVTVPHMAAFAAAPPGCNFAGAEESWRRVAAEVRSRRSL